MHRYDAQLHIKFAIHNCKASGTNLCEVPLNKKLRIDQRGLPGMKAFVRSI